MSSPEPCPNCGRAFESAGAQICEHCAAIVYLVWDWCGTKEPPSPSDYRAWAASSDGTTVERRLKRHFTNRWANEDGSMRRVPVAA